MTITGHFFYWNAKDPVLDHVSSSQLDVCMCLHPQKALDASILNIVFPLNRSASVVRWKAVHSLRTPIGIKVTVSVRFVERNCERDRTSMPRLELFRAQSGKRCEAGNLQQTLRRRSLLQIVCIYLLIMSQ